MYEYEQYVQQQWVLHHGDCVCVCMRFCQPLVSAAFLEPTMTLGAHLSLSPPPPLSSPTHTLPDECVHSFFQADSLKALSEFVTS